MADYSKMTDKDFDYHLEKTLHDVRAETLLQIPGIYEILAERYNNEVLDAWAEDNPCLAYPEDCEEDGDE